MVKISIFASFAVLAATAYSAAIPSTDLGVATEPSTDLGVATEPSTDLGPARRAEVELDAREIEARGNSPRKMLATFIAEIPAAKLTSFPSSAGTIYTDNDCFRLDMQGLTSAKAKRGSSTKKGSSSKSGSSKSGSSSTTTKKKQSHNLQIQVNKGCSNSALAKIAPATVAGPVFVEVGSTASATAIRAQFVAKMANI